MYRQIIWSVLFHYNNLPWQYSSVSMHPEFHVLPPVDQLLSNHTTIPLTIQQNIQQQIVVDQLLSNHIAIPLTIQQNIQRQIIEAQNSITLQFEQRTFFYIYIYIYIYIDAFVVLHKLILSQNSNLFNQTSYVPTSRAISSASAISSCNGTFFYWTFFRIYIYIFWRFCCLTQTYIKSKLKLFQSNNLCTNFSGDCT